MMVDLLDVAAALTIWTFLLVALLHPFPPRMGFLATAVAILLVAIAEAFSLTEASDGLGVLALTLLGCSIVYEVAEVAHPRVAS